MKPSEFFADFNPDIYADMAKMALSQVNNERLSFTLKRKGITPATHASHRVFACTSSMKPAEKYAFLCALSFIAEKHGRRFNVTYRGGNHRIYLNTPRGMPSSDRLFKKRRFKY